MLLFKTVVCKTLKLSFSRYYSLEGGSGPERTVYLSYGLFPLMLGHNPKDGMIYCNPGSGILVAAGSSDSCFLCT